MNSPLWGVFVVVAKVYNMKEKCKVTIEKFMKSSKTIEKMRAAKLGFKNPNFRKFGKENKSSKPVLQFDLNEELVASYPSIDKANELTGINISSIGMCCKGKRNTSGGFIWKYKNKVSSK